MDYEYGIVGGGPAGYTAGLMLAKQGHSVVLFEQDLIGGTCLNRGCIPTKSFLHSSQVYKQICSAQNYGIDTNIKGFNFSKIVELKNNTVERLRKSLETVIKASGIKVVNSKAEIADNTTIKADGQEYKVGQIINATGSTPREIKGLEFDKKFILSSDDVLEMKNLPKSVLIIGSGAIGIEWSRIFSSFGVKVSIVEMAEHLIPNADIEVSKRIERIFKKDGISFYTNNYVEKIVNKKVYLYTGEIIEPDFILIAVGRVNSEEKKEGILNIGDVSGEIQLAHYAIHQAKNFALNIDFDKSLVPSVIYGEPEIAWVGKREQDCNEECKKITLPISALGKSWCDNSTEGFIKLIERKEQIVGAHIVSKEASALIHTVLVAMQNKISINDLKKICFAHPTYSEGIFETIMRF